jgi:hypothetical protein
VLFLDEKKKKLIYFLGTLFVAVAFISSYAAVGSFASTSTVTTTITASRTYFVSGSANGVVSGYSNGATLVLSNSSFSAKAGNVLTALEDNGSISSFIDLSGNYQVLLSTMNAYSLQQYMDKQLNSSNATSVNASTYIALPSKVELFLGSQAIPVTLTQTNYSVSIYPLLPLNTTVKFNLNAIVSGNGTVYNNQLTLKQA